jgi:hypothetical protein
MLPQLNRLIEDSFDRDEISVSDADDTDIPSQHRVTQQILHWQPFQDLKLMFAGWQPFRDLKLMLPDSRRAEQLSLRSQQRVVVAALRSLSLRRRRQALSLRKRMLLSVFSSSSQ